MNFLVFGFPIFALLIGIDFIATNRRWLKEYRKKGKRCSSKRTVMVIDVKEEDDGTWVLSFRDYGSGTEQTQEQRGNGPPPSLLPGRSYQLRYNPVDPKEQMPLTDEEYSIRRIIALAGVALTVAGGGAMAILLAWPH